MTGIPAARASGNGPNGKLTVCPNCSGVRRLSAAAYSSTQVVTRSWASLRLAGVWNCGGLNSPPLSTGCIAVIKPVTWATTSSADLAVGAGFQLSLSWGTKPRLWAVFRPTQDIWLAIPSIGFMLLVPFVRFEAPHGGHGSPDGNPGLSAAAD